MESTLMFFKVVGIDEGVAKGKVQMISVRNINLK
jgi:hypothetical protein